MNPPKLLAGISPENVKKLIRLSDEAKRTQHEHAAVLKEYNATLLKKAQSKEAKRLAQKAKVEFYDSIGLCRQSSYQIINLAKGLCRQCGGTEDEKGGLCQSCRSKPWEARKKLVGQ